MKALTLTSRRPSSPRHRMAGVLVKRAQASAAVAKVDPMFSRIHSAESFELDSVRESFGVAYAKSRANA